MRTFCKSMMTLRNFKRLWPATPADVSQVVSAPVSAVGDSTADYC